MKLPCFTETRLTLHQLKIEKTYMLPQEKKKKKKLVETKHKLKTWVTHSQTHSLSSLQEKKKKKKKKVIQDVHIYIS